MLTTEFSRRQSEQMEKIVEADIINLFSFTLHYNISKWGENFVHDHPNCTFEELEQTFANISE
jgi:hypothetical protein